MSMKRVTCILSEEQHDLMIKLKDQMDVDLSKLIKWTIEASFRLSKEDCRNNCKDPQTKYLLDSIANLDKKG